MLQVFLHGRKKIFSRRREISENEAGAQVSVQMYTLAKSNIEEEQVLERDLILKLRMCSQFKIVTLI